MPRTAEEVGGCVLRAIPTCGLEIANYLKDEDLANLKKRMKQFGFSLTLEISVVTGAKA
jgi:hypothetical protein